MASIPIINIKVSELKDLVWTKLQEPKSQRKLILVIVSIALLLDNMLYMVIVPIIPDYLRYVGAWGKQDLPEVAADNVTANQGSIQVHPDHHGQDQATGVLFASKAIVQLMVNPFSGALIDRIGYDMPMMIGLTIMFLSTAVFACGRSYGVLFFARSLQGVGSAFADTSGLAMIADRFTEENERSKALGIALAFISFGCLVAPPFGGALYQFAGKEVPFLILAFVSLADGFMLLLVMKPIKEQIKESRRDKPPSIPIWRLFIDPYIAVCSGALMMSNVALAFLEPTISLWMEDNLTTDNWKIGMIWLPAFFPHVFGVILTVKLAKRYPQYQWLMAAGGLALEGLCCFIIPFSSSYKVLMIPICGICFGIALIDTALLPTLGYLVDVRYVSVYGSIYAIADISYSVAYAIGPIIAGGVVEAIGFTALNVGIAFSNLLYAPMLMYLRHIYDFKPLENQANILMSDPPDKQYQTYTMQDQKPVIGDLKNHLEYSRFPDESTSVSNAYYPDGQPTQMQETNLDKHMAEGSNEYTAGDSNYYSGQQYRHEPSSQQHQQQQQYVQQGYQTQYQQGYQPQQQRQQPSYSSVNAQRPESSRGDTNPFRAHGAGGGTETGDRNPFRQGWRETLFSLPRRLFGGAGVSSGEGDLSGADGQNIVLPKLPVPSLEQTLERYLATVKPIVSDAQYERTRAMVKAFGSSNGPGQRLQETLLQLREEQDNWAYTWWLNDMYLNNPIPLPINSNPGMVFPPRSFRSSHDMARFAARIMAGILSHKDIMDRHAIPVERATSREKGQPLCMSQYYRLLTSYRQPGKPRDCIYSKVKHGEEEKNNETENIIVACRNQLYVVTLKPAGQNRLTEDKMASQFLHIIQEAPHLPPPTPVGILTSERRDTWAVLREKLREEKRNRQNLDLIENALLVVCFDDPLPASFNCRTLRSDVPEAVRGHIVDSRDETNMAHQMIHGGGSAANSANRWFDMTVQIVISSDGVWGLCYEHSPSEGVAVVQVMEDVLKKCDSTPVPTDNISSNIQCEVPQRLEWVLHQGSHQYIQDAIQNIDLMVEDLDFYVYRFPGYGKELIKSVKCSPDAYIQLALQLAYFRLYRKLVATYESASTRRFLLGRVDCIRSAHIEALQWVTAMCQDESGAEESEPSDIQSGKRVTFSLFGVQQKLQLFDEAMKKQTEIMVENILGQGIDIHLLGLRELAKDLREPLPDIFQDEAYRTANHFALSTSQVPTSSDSFMGYGPVVPDGYGASYNPHADTIVFCLSAFHSCETTSTWRLAHSLEESLNSMKDLLSSRKTTK